MKNDGEMTEQQIKNFNFRGTCIPEHMIGGALRYFNDHIQPGSFLRALMSNDLMTACNRGDEENLDALAAWAAFLYNEAPRGSFGSPEKVKTWLAAREKENPE